MRSRAAIAGIIAVVAALAVPGGVAFGAESPANAQASCVATITSYEASQLQPGAVRKEVSALATSAPGIAGAIVSDLSKEHASSLDACVGG